MKAAREYPKNSPAKLAGHPRPAMTKFNDGNTSTAHLEHVRTSVWGTLVTRKELCDEGNQGFIEVEFGIDDIFRNVCGPKPSVSRRQPL